MRNVGAVPVLYYSWNSYPSRAQQHGPCSNRRCCRRRQGKRTYPFFAWRPRPRGRPGVIYVCLPFISLSMYEEMEMDCLCNYICIRRQVHTSLCQHVILRHVCIHMYMYTFPVNFLIRDAVAGPSPPKFNSCLSTLLKDFCCLCSVAICRSCFYIFIKAKADHGRIKRRFPCESTRVVAKGSNFPQMKVSLKYLGLQGQTRTCQRTRLVD